MSATTVRPSAAFSPCRTWRYALWRDTATLTTNRGTVLIVGLNPSTADEVQNDPTIRRCIAFARDWGYHQLAMGNLYGYRATNPAELADAADPIGPDNLEWIARLAAAADLIVAAWGAHPTAAGDHATEVLDVLELAGPVHCLGRAQHGAPRHPLYLPADTIPERYTPVAA